MDLTNLFDTYSLRARLQPALLTLFPFFVTIAVLFPALYQFATALVGLGTACGVTVLFSHIVRMRGRSVEERLFAKWGAKPTTAHLTHKDGHVDPHTKARYHRFLALHVPGWHAPTQEDETKNQKGTAQLYDAAVKWLLEFTRDKKKFPLVFKENISYGFRRNLYGLKAIGLSLSLVCLAANGIVAYTKFESVESTGVPLLLGSLGLVLTFVAAWNFLITEHWVRDAAHAYSRALLAACDS